MTGISLLRQKFKLGEMLTRAGRINAVQLDAALAHQKTAGGRLGTALIKLGYITERELLGFLAEQLGMPLVDLAKEVGEPASLALITRQRALELNVVPLRQQIMHGANCLLVAMSDPTNYQLIDSLRFMVGQRILPALALEADIRTAIDRFYGGPEETSLPERAPSESAGNPVEVRIKALEATEIKYQTLLKVLLGKGILTPREYERLR